VGEEIFLKMIDDDYYYGYDFWEFLYIYTLFVSLKWDDYG